VTAIPLESSNAGSSGVAASCGPYLRNLRMDRWFAPVAERLTVLYDIHGLSGGEVILEVKSATYARDPIYVRPLSASEKADGTDKRIETWDGTLTGDCPVGELRDALCISGLHSPYRVRIYVPDTAHAVVGSFQVLYEHLLMKRAPWCPGVAPTRAADLAKWARYRLNQLGYFGGPFAADVDDYQKNAVIRYKMSHHDLYETDYAAYNGTIGGGMADILEAADAPRRVAFGVVDPGGDPAEMTADQVLTAFPSRDWPGTRGRMFLIWNHVATTFGDELNTLTRAELDDDTRPEVTTVMRGRLNRPLLPVEVEVHVRTKADDHVFSPRAVGPVRVRWSHMEPWEDPARQFPDRAARNSYPRKYIAKALKEEGGQNIAGLNNNCPAKYGGLRTGDTNKDKNLFLAYIDAVREQDDIIPYCYTQAYTGAEYPNRVGKASVYFRPSKIAGDRYALLAYLDFRDRRNRRDLEAAHAPLPIMTQSHVFENRRRARIGTVVQWPARAARRVNILDASGNQATVPIDIPLWDVAALARLRTEFAVAYIDLDLGMAAVDVTTVLGNDEYVGVVGAAAPAETFRAPALRREGLLRLQDIDHPELINTTLRSGGAWGRMQAALAQLIVRRVRINRRDTSDIILVDLLVIEPADVRGNVSGEPRTIRSFTVIDGSEGMGNGLAFIGQAYHAPGAFFSIAHEVGHCLWLRHWENSNRQFPNDHDGSDHSCIMSYPILRHATYGPAVFDPHFCGKCNLKLRGWDVKKLPANSD
jgi:hypothetical protein